ncbi:MAG: DegQ family serine endoprotease [Deltaproteobacteria bacterium]|nr:DegQ family serine endoprotease [Deltaproteobacteria bacterium]MBI2500656.1 DegQ family serine endoprotease [Deltaproteobacteria bacterium]MBI4197161.1 DegQ family serine endoprotease [Deltaproteobacteria bacterium]
MRRKLVIFWGLGMGLLGLLVGGLLKDHFQATSSAEAVEYARPVQPVGLFGGTASPTGLPSFAELADKVSPSVVNISTTKKVQRQATPRGFRGPGPQDPFDDFFDRFFQGPGPGPSERPQRSLGSGFIFGADGHIITNNHVIEGADEIQVQLTDKRKFDAEIIGTDPKTDLAVIKIKAKELPAVVLGDSNQLHVGDWVMAVGNPFGLDHTVTAGIVSAKGRVIGAGPYDDFIQTDASINPGNSGGPLFNLKGEVVGVNSAIVAAAQGIGFAIPINMAKELVPQLVKSGKVTRAWLGVGIQELTPELAESFGLKEPKGALVGNVFPNSPADKAGLKAGDIVTEFDGNKILDSHALPNLVAHLPVGKESIMKVLRDGKEKELKVKLGEMEEGEKQAAESTSTTSGELGLAVRDLTPEEMREVGVKEGVLVMGVEGGSSADFGGIQRGDILLSLNNVKIVKSSDFERESKKIKKGQIVRLHIKRDDTTIFLAFSK